MNLFASFTKGYYARFGIILQTKKNIIFFLLIISICLIICPLQSELKRYLVILFFISWIFQCLLLINRSFVFFIFRTLILVFLVFEIIFGYLNSKVIISNTYGDGRFIFQENYIYVDSVIGVRVNPNISSVRSTEILYGDTLYDVYYSTDKYGRRISEDTMIIDTTFNKIRTKHAIFLGCSFTFGMGLKYTSTFPYIFEKNHTAYKSYNYSYVGYAPHQNCLLFDNGINTLNNTSVPEDSGFCIYSYFDPHLERVYAGSKYLSWGSDSPDIYIENGQVVRHKRSKIKQYLAWILNNSETCKYFNIEFTYPKNEEFYRRFADIVNYTANKYYDMKPHGKFYVGLYPMSENIKDTTWIKYLNRNITILNVAPPNDYETNLSYKILKDGHPSVKLNEYYERNFSKLIFKSNF